MKRSDIVLGKYYRHKENPRYAWAKALEIIEPRSGVNTHNYPIVKCEWTVNRDDTIGLIKYFKVSDLEEV